MALDPGLRRLALGTLLAAFGGTTVPPWAHDLMGDGIAGYVLFGYTTTDRDQVAALTADLRAARADVLVGIDEEGGDVTRMYYATGSPYPGNAALGVVDDTALTGEVYRAIGADLAAVGVNLDLAPTVDVNTADDNPIIGTRAFGSVPERVAAHSAAAVGGLQRAGVAACVKHFPGHGATVTDSHLTLPTVDAPWSLVRGRDLPPFAAAIQAGARAVMTAHIRVPALTGDLPATFSRPALVDLLRTELGFDGVVVTDALDMAGASGGIGIPAAAVQALAAGADLLCLAGEADAALVEAVAAAIVEALAGGALPLAPVERAVARNADLAAWCAARSGTAGPGLTDADRALCLDVARRALRLTGTPPELAGALVVELDSPSTIAAGTVPWGLAPHLATAERLPVAAADPGISADTLAAKAGDRPIVLVGRDIHRHSADRALAEALAARHPVVVVEMGWPSRWRPAGAAAHLVTYGASRANGRAAAELLGLA